MNEHPDITHWRVRYEDMRREAQKLGEVIDRRNAEIKRLRADIDSLAAALREYDFGGAV